MPPQWHDAESSAPVVHLGSRVRLRGPGMDGGEIAVALTFDGLGYYRDGWAPYRLAGREGRIDQDGNIRSDTVVQPSISDANTNRDPNADSNS